jgi:Holliday junction DNA helicase RuvA
MIAHLRGRLLTKDPNRAVVEAAGVGYELAISVPTYSELPNAGAEVALHVHTHVREDVIALFGFLRTDEKRLFERLIAVSGIGPKLAITILSGMSAGFLVAAIRGNDLAALTKVPGIGKKTAERMVLELRDKLDAFAAAPANAAEKAIAAAAENERSSFDRLFKAAMAQLRR